MNEKGPFPGSSAEQAAALIKRVRSLRWKPETIMRETVLIQQLRESILLDTAEA